MLTWVKSPLLGRTQALVGKPPTVVLLNEHVQMSPKCLCCVCADGLVLLPGLAKEVSLYSGQQSVQGLTPGQSAEGKSMLSAHH